MGLLVFIHTQKSTLTFYEAQNWYTIVHPWSLKSKNSIKKESQYIVDLGILEECSAFEGTSPYFIVSQKMVALD